MFFDIALIEAVQLLCESVVAAFIADTTMGLTNKEKKSESYKVPIKFFDTLGEQKGLVYLTAENTAAYDEAMTMLSSDQDLNDVIAGDGGEASDDETESLWNVKVSCKPQRRHLHINIQQKQGCHKRILKRLYNSST